MGVIRFSTQCICFATVALAAVANLSAQVTSKVEYVRAVELDENGTRISGSYLITPADEAFKLSSAALVTFEGLDDFPPGGVVVEAENQQWDNVPIFEVLASDSVRQYLVFQRGKVRLALEAFSADPLRIERERVVVDIPSPIPDDDDDEDDKPTPDVPDDAFENIGQRVAKWSDGLTNKSAYAAIYRKAANSLRTLPNATIDSVQNEMLDAFRAQSNNDAYSEKVGKPLSKDLSDRWPLTRGVLADYFEAVAIGLGG